MPIILPKIKQTPLRHCPNAFGIRQLLIKEENHTLTHTFKDRLAFEMLAPIIDNINSGKHILETTFGCISYGNAAYSIGYYCNILNKLYGRKLVNAIFFFPKNFRLKTLGPDTSGKYLKVSDFINKIKEKSILIEIDLDKTIY